MTTFYLCFNTEDAFEGYDPSVFIANACKIVKLEQAHQLEDLNLENFKTVAEKALGELIDDNPQLLVFSDIYTEEQILSATA